MNQTLVSYLSQYEFYDVLLKAFGNNQALLATTIYLLFAAAIVGLMATVGGLGTYAERKISADIQQRIGPNRVGPYGLLQFLADGVKMLTKEDVMPFTADKFLFYLAPMLALVGVLATLAVLPWSSGFIMADLNVGIFYLIAISSLVGVSVFLGGYASNSKWSMLGGLRGASQIISYEIPVTISILAITLLAGGMGFGTILSHQKGIFHNPFSFIAFFIYGIGALAETNRAPFDLPEAESELVSGYHTEYTGMRFGMFALAEYIEVFVVCGVAAALFLGGGNLPFHIELDIIPLQLAQVAIFMSKALLLYYVVIWVRWTFPRLRVDQLMTICWKYLTPIAIFNLIGCAVWTVVFNGKSIADLVFGAGH
jgi:NADH-quinone oxidoreductase subunit H